MPCVFINFHSGDFHGSREKAGSLGQQVKLGRAAARPSLDATNRAGNREHRQNVDLVGQGG